MVPLGAPVKAKESVPPTITFLTVIPACCVSVNVQVQSSPSLMLMATEARGFEFVVPPPLAFATEQLMEVRFQLDGTFSAAVYVVNVRMFVKACEGSVAELLSVSEKLAGDRLPDIVNGKAV